GCLTTTLIAHSAALGVKINKVESRYEGDIDLQGFLGISEEVPVQYQRIRVFFKVDAGVSAEKKKELIRMAQKYSPVFNSVTKEVPVSVGLEGS
ncbi:OsmC family peroxiredoxin, partial [bacterium]